MPPLRFNVACSWSILSWTCSTSSVEKPVLLVDATLALLVWGAGVVVVAVVVVAGGGRSKLSNAEAIFDDAGNEVEVEVTGAGGTVVEVGWNASRWFKVVLLLEEAVAVVVTWTGAVTTGVAVAVTGVVTGGCGVATGATTAAAVAVGGTAGACCRKCTIGGGSTSGKDCARLLEGEERSQW